MRSRSRAHPRFERAHRYWHEEGARAPAIHLWRVTMLGFLRVLTQPKLMGAAALSAAQALPEYAREPWFVPRFWTDAYLAAFARAAGLRLVTFDRDFARFQGLELLALG